MAGLTTLVNIGKELDRKLKSVGITTAEELIEVGAEGAFVRLKMYYPNISLVHLYAIEGAITGTDFDKLPEVTKRKLKDISDYLK